LNEDHKIRSGGGGRDRRLFTSKDRQIVSVKTPLSVGGVVGSSMGGVVARVDRVVIFEGSKRGVSIMWLFR